MKKQLLGDTLTQLWLTKFRLDRGLCPPLPGLLLGISREKRFKVSD